MAVPPAFFAVRPAGQARSHRDRPSRRRVVRLGHSSRGNKKRRALSGSAASRCSVLRNDIASYAFIVDAKDDISHASRRHRRWSRAAADMLFAEETPLHDSVLRLITDLDDLRETLGRSKLQFYGLALAEERPAVADQDGIDRDIEHVEQALLKQSLAEETVA
jgi:hypothetical protein